MNLERFPPVSATFNAEDAEHFAFLKRMAELVPGIIYVFNHKTQSNEYSNRSLTELLGYSSAEALAMGDMLMQTLLHPDDLARLGGHFDALGQHAEDSEVLFEYRARHKDGHLVWLRGIDSVFERDAEGAILRHIGIAIDITSQKEAEDRLRENNLELEARVIARTAELKALNEELEARVAQRTAQLDEMNRDLKQLTYVATHDLKVPINNMCSLSNMLSEAKDILPPEHVETLGWMEDVCQQASDKLDALVGAAQAHMGAMDPFEDIDLEIVSEQVLMNLHYQIQSARAVVSTDFKAKTVFFLAPEVENILQSLIGNAVKYTQQGRRPRIIVRSFEEDEMVHVEIDDNGSGLNLPTDEDKVFGLFQRAHTHPEGAGVSLFTIRRIMERIGGTIHVESTYGAGSIFRVSFPSAEQDVAT